MRQRIATIAAAVLAAALLAGPVPAQAADDVLVALTVSLTTDWAIYGKNALALFVLSGLFARALAMIRVEAGGERMALKTWIFSRIFLPLGDARFASFLFAFAMVLLFWGVAAAMERKRWFLKL